ncbi:MAG: tetratricopeptide repeat protein [Planctomycetia bacterium]|nr:tetratricopeptide repeat protein [Planctomycetia bacterium]
MNSGHIDWWAWLGRAALTTGLVGCLATAPGGPATADEPPAAVENEPGQADLDAAVDKKLAVRRLDDYGEVLDLCRAALRKGLSEDSRAFAEELLTGTLVERADMVVEAIFGSRNPDPQWPRMRSFALRDLAEAIEREPDLAAAHLAIARLEALPRGDRQRALAAASRAIELAGDDGLLAARAHLVRGNLEEEDAAKRRADYDRAVELAPGDKDVRRTRGLFHLLADDYERCRADLEAAIEIDPDDASLLEALGTAALMDQRLDEARQAFDRALEIDPDSTGALVQRARTRALGGDRGAAIDDLDTAVKLAPDDPEPLLLRARILQQAGDTAKAQADLGRVLAANPDHLAALEMRGLLAADRNDYGAAIDDFRRLARLDADNPVVAAQLGMLYLAAKQPRAARQRFDRALELDEALFMARRGRGDAALAIGDHQSARADLERAVELEPDNESVLNNLAWLLATSPDDAIRDGRKAIGIATKACERTAWKESHILSTLAAAYAETGDFATARRYSRQAVDLDDTPEEVRQQLRDELASYEREQPWRERQQVDDAGVHIAAPEGSHTPLTPAPSSPPAPAPRRPFD